MNTKIIIGAIIGAVVIVGGGVLLMTGGEKVGKVSSACANICEKANQTCPSLINEDICNSNCDNLSEDTKKHIEESTTCEQISSRPDLIVNLLIPEGATPKPTAKDASECEAACGSYVGKCLTLVPNATEALFNDGLKSCMQECAGKWDNKKVDCMVSAFDCEAMTNVCGL